MAINMHIIQRTRWMAAFAEEVTRLSPKHSGKINWDAAAFFYLQGRDPKEVAADFVTNEPPQ